MRRGSRNTGRDNADYTAARPVEPNPFTARAVGSKRIPLTGDDVEKLLWDGEPRIAVGGAGSFLPFPPNFEPNISIVPYQLEAGEERLIADRVHAVLSQPPQKSPRTDPPAADVTGQWDVDLTFVHGTARQSFALEQKGNNLIGTHTASFASRDVAGTLHGQDILLRSHTRNRVCASISLFAGRSTATYARPG